VTERLKGDRRQFWWVFCETSSLVGVNLEFISRFPYSGGWIRKPEHGPAQGLSVQHEFHVMVIREIRTLIEVERSAIEGVGRSTTPSRYKIEHSIMHEPFVIVNVTRSDDESSSAGRSAGFQKLRQSDLIGPWIVIDDKPALNVSHGRVVHGNQHELNLVRQ